MPAPHSDAALLDAWGRRIEPDASLASQVARLQAAAASDPLLQQRSDGWQNLLTGLGTASDKTRQGRFFPTWRVDDSELTWLYDSDATIANIVDDPVRHMFREGFSISSEGLEESKCKDLVDYCEEQYELTDTFVQAYTWARLYGGCLIVMGIDDGRMPWEPLDEENIRSVDFMAVVDRRYAYANTTYSSFGSPAGKYGLPETYLITNAIAGMGWDDPKAARIRKKTPTALARSGAYVSIVHETRCIRLEGNRADVQTRQRLAGWDYSIVQRVYEAVRQFVNMNDSISYLLSDASQGVLKVRDLFKAISAGREDDIMMRARVAEMTRSVMRSLILDAGDKDGKGAESFERVTTPMSGYADIIDRGQMLVASAARRPVSTLFGRAPQGLSATGDADMRAWYGDMQADQRTSVGPRLRRAYAIVARSKSGPVARPVKSFTIDFHPLWSPTDLETAQSKFANAQADALNIESGVVSAEEVALGLRDTYPHIDFDAREQAVNALKAHDPHENDPPPEPGDPDYVDPNPPPAAPPGARAGKPKPKKPAAAKP